MARSESGHPTELELELLKVLWDQPPLSVRDVRDMLEEDAGRDLSYSTVITMLNIMVDKGYVRRKKRGRAFLFTPRVKKDRVTGGIVGDVVTRLFGGSTAALVVNLIETSNLNAEELSELRKLISRKSQRPKK